MEAIPFT